MSGTLSIAMNAFIHKKATPIDGAWSYEPIIGHTKYEGKFTMGERELQFRGDGRGFGEPGTSRVSWRLDIPLDALGSLHTRKPYEKWLVSRVGMSHQRRRSRGGDIMGGLEPWTPWVEDSLRAVDGSEIVEVGPSHVEVRGEAGYPFNPLAPDIDFTFRVALRRNAGGRLEVRMTGTHDLFPFYEILVGGKLVWKYAPTDSGPDPINLNRQIEGWPLPGAGKFDESIEL